MTTPAPRPLDVEERVVRFDPETVAQKPAGDTLVDLGRELEFFTTALIVQFGHFDRDPIIECYKALNCNVQSFVINCQEPLFEGLGQGVLLGQPVDWDHRLYAVRREDWITVRDTISGIAWLDRPRELYTRSMFHELSLVDPTAFYKHGGLLATLPLFTITVFGISSNKGLTYLAPAKNPPQTRPYPVTELPLQGAVQEAARMLGQPLAQETLSRHRKDSR